MLAADRRNALVDCAQELFFTVGYEPTTVANIIERAGISKGGFYHHFSAKEELLDAIAERMALQLIAGSKDVLDDPDIDSLTRLNRFLERSLQWKTQTARQLRVLSEAILKPENVLLFERMVSVVNETLHPLLAGIIRQGAEEGVFSTVSPDIVAEVYLSMARGRGELISRSIAAALDGNMDQAVAGMADRLRHEASAMDRLLGAPEGSVHMFDTEELRPLFEAIVAG